MPRDVIRTDAAPAAIGPYSQAIQAADGFVFCSGQIPLTARGEMVTGDIGTQTRQCLENVTAVLAAAGLELANVVKTTVFLSSMDHFSAMNAVYGEFFSVDPPARSTVAVAGLPKGADVEIEVVAHP